MTVAAPYSRLAEHYDEMLGEPMLRLLCRNFERLAPRFGIRFRDAADLGCGTGLFARYLSRRFRVPVIAVDRSAEMTRVAARNCRDLPVTILRQDLRDLALPSPVDLITSNYDTLNHLLDPAELARVFRRIAGHLRPGGHFIADLITPSIGYPPGVVLEKRLRKGAATVLQQVRLLPSRRLLLVRIIEKRPHRPHPAVEFHQERLYPVGLVRRLLRRAGLRIRALLDALGLTAFVQPPSRMVVVCSKA
jgi:SAM-dependent methyltransferase